MITILNEAIDNDIEDDFKYRGSQYFDSRYWGLEDDYETNDFESLIDWLWDKVAEGGFFRLEGPDGSVDLSSDEVEDLYYEGDFDKKAIRDQIG